MTDETQNPDEPYWVSRMRDAGYSVRVGTSNNGIPFEPEVSFRPPARERSALRRRLNGLVQKLWNRGAPLMRRIVHR
ncbi:MAG TPA: hypothetical protein VFJ16_02520 [Longimicrobium sp.]|nr:hypothetical protein [Longimicrobium sp.]